MKNRKWIQKMLTLALAGTMLAGCGSTDNAANAEGEANKLEGTEFNLFTWDGMFPQEVLDGFEEKTGVKINYSNFDYDEDMLAKLEETKGGDYDFVIADDYILEMIKEENLYQALDTSKIKNWGNINPLYQGQFYDPEDEFTVPYGAGIPLIVYDPALVDIEIKGYGDLWDPSLEDNVALIANYRVIDGITLKTMGESFNTNDLDVIKAAGEKLKELAPNVRVINDNNTQDFLITGEVGAAFLYTSQVYEALSARDDLEVVYPEEGLGFGIMAGFIPSDAPNADAAYAFIDYLLEPEISAKCFEYIGYYCTTKAAEDYISEEMKPFLVVPDTVTEGESIQNISDEAEQLHSEIWNEFKNACD
ncbi:MAG: spermidine/putrescine ABC transporter substrate-binding protein [Lachnospiraceae bacterium]|nr:spermidine/putrescine ABC transporter substrate-binding protein [Lachnospiraceae bacterium]